MTPSSLPHIAFPPRFALQADGSWSLATVEQHADAETMAAVATVVACPRGHRDDLPAFGVDIPVFEQGALDTERLLAQITQSYPTAGLDVDELLDITDAAVRTVRIAVTRP
jgi:hypothetical protein